MAISNSLYTFMLPFILLSSVPLALFATVTSCIAFSILAFRVLLVYAELALAVIPHYFRRTASSSSSKPYLSTIPRIRSFVASPQSSHTAASSATIAPVRRRSRRGSSASVNSLTPVASTSSFDLPIPLPPSAGPQRDFEGVGGWRLDPPSEDEKVWTNINSRLELPADHIRRHRRSTTGGSVPSDRRRGERSYSPELLMMASVSPNTSRARTPPTHPVSGIGGDGYFSQVGGGRSGSPRAAKQAASIVTAASGSSTSSKGSGGLSMKSR